MVTRDVSDERGDRSAGEIVRLPFAAMDLNRARRRRRRDGEHRFVIEQGYEMGRPSQIELGLSVQGGALMRATIGGSAVIVSDGNIEA